jgi:hypothetical protein
MAKGRKTCDKCGTQTGPRAYMCKNCNTPFMFKNKSREDRNTKIIRNINWRELQKGDKIKVAGGPYDFIPMGYRGKFLVERVDENGILAWGLDKNAGFCHIWMNGDIQNKETGVWKTPHKILKLKQKLVLV